MHDVTVMGAGFAGLIAAVRAQQLGLRVAVVERSPGVPGESNARLSGGVFHVAFTDPRTRTPSELLDAIMRATDGVADPAVARAVAEHASRVIQWLEDLGVEFVSDAPPEYRNQVLGPFLPAGPGFRWEGRGPMACLETLAARLEADGATVIPGARGAQIRRVEDRYELQVVTGGGAQTVPTRAVILADGGFHSDPEALRDLAGVNPDNIVVRGSGSSQGDGIRLGRQLGGFLVKASSLYGHLLSTDARHNAQLLPYPWLDPVAQHGLVVSSTGHRVGWPGLSAVGYVNLVARASSDLRPWAVCDADAWEGPATLGAIPANPLVRELGGTLVEAASLAELAASIGVSAAALEAAVEQHNRLVDEVGSARLPGAKHRAARVARPPFVAAPVLAGITNTLGGLAIDGTGRVLGVDGDAVGRLYAAGACAGGLQGSATGGYVGGLVEAGVLGLLTAEDVSHRVPGSTSEGEDQRVGA